jgi:hypothetical protein
MEPNLNPIDPQPPSSYPIPPAPGKIPNRPRGKIAQLPPAVRDQINQLLDEGLVYADLITRLGPDGAKLNETDISRWYKSGHQDWLRNQLWLEETRSRLDFAIDVISENEGSSVHQANLHIAATQLIQNLISCGEAVLQQHPDQYVSLVNSITRLSREALNFQKYREACALARTELEKLKDPDRKLSEAETLAIVNRLDEILGFK